MKRVAIIVAAIGLVPLAVGSAAAGPGGAIARTVAVRATPGVHRSIDGIRRPIAPHRVASATDCTATTAAGATNTQLDCDSQLPNNEPHIAIDPADPLHMVASSNDYDSCCDEFYTTFDGG